MKKLLILTLSVALVLSGCAPKAATPSIVVPPTGVQAPSQTKADMDKIVADYQINFEGTHMYYDFKGAFQFVDVESR